MKDRHTGLPPYIRISHLQNISGLVIFGRTASSRLLGLEEEVGSDEEITAACCPESIDIVRRTAALIQTESKEKEAH